MIFVSKLTKELSSYITDPDGVDSIWTTCPQGVLRRSIMRIENQEHAARRGKEELAMWIARWEYIKAEPDAARHLLRLLQDGKGTADDFDDMIDRVRRTA